MQKILIIGHVWPESKSSAAGTRMMQLIGLFQDANWEITFASASELSGFEDSLETKGIRRIKIELNQDSFDLVLRELQPEIVLFDRFYTEEQFSWRVAMYCPNAIRILDTEDLHLLRSARETCVKSGRPLDDDALYSVVAKREIASIMRSDLTLIISTFEMELLQQKFKISPSLLFYLPFILEENELDGMESHLAFDKRKDFVFIGNFLHQPNWDAVLQLKKVIWKEIKSRFPEASMHIYGSYATQKVLDLHDAKAGFLVHGRTENAREVLGKALVCLAPLRFGAGIKGKLLDAMLVGTPSVTSTVGAEGMHDGFEWPGMVADDVTEFADAAVLLATNEKRWKQAQLLGTEIVRSKFLKKTYAKAWNMEIERLMSELEKHRRENFMGEMLLHHRQMGVRYLAKWIEIKNSGIKR